MSVSYSNYCYGVVLGSAGIFTQTFSLGLRIEQLTATPLTCVVSAYGGAAAAVRYTGKRGTLINKDSLSSADESSAILITRPAPKLLIPLFCTLSPAPHSHTRAWTRLSVVNCATSMPVLRPPPLGLSVS